VLKRRSGDPPVLVASSRRARRELGWHPQHSQLDEMLADAWAWRVGHPQGYAAGLASGDGHTSADPADGAPQAAQGGAGVNPVADRSGTALAGGSASPQPSMG
jgi:hypothetical protein